MSIEVLYSIPITEENLYSNKLVTSLNPTLWPIETPSGAIIVGIDGSTANAYAP